MKTGLWPSSKVNNQFLGFTNIESKVVVINIFGFLSMYIQQQIIFILLDINYLFIVLMDKNLSQNGFWGYFTLIA